MRLSVLVAVAFVAVVASTSPVSAQAQNGITSTPTFVQSGGNTYLYSHGTFSVGQGYGATHIDIEIGYVQNGQNVSFNPKLEERITNLQFPNWSGVQRQAQPGFKYWVKATLKGFDYSTMPPTAAIMATAAGVTP